jgi:hypothetical protein
MPRPEPSPVPSPEPLPPNPEPGPPMPPIPRVNDSPFSDAAPIDYPEPTPEPEPEPEPPALEEAPEEGPKSEVEAARKKIVNAPDISLFEEPSTKTGAHQLPTAKPVMETDGFKPGRARVKNLLDRSELPDHIPLPRPTVYGAKPAEGEE